ncbi:MAG: Gfo/Idh/MocA family oxidoreductase [Melioribacteraceae bacterium]|nr:Gfo/Idh/MocA family oxidoreductase [Melioribacteraceae bacterium]
MKNFALTGVAGYVAPRHLKAIKDTNNNLIAALDPHDSVGILDRFFSEAHYFSEFDRFDRHLEKLKRSSEEQSIDYLSICSPNHLHDAHIRLALRVGADAICEKPIVLNPWNLDLLQELENETGKKVFTILQLRVHPSLIELKEKISKSNSKKKHDVCLTYITSRGPWYHFSWKGDSKKSGGVGTNIGIHFFDLLIWLFGNVQSSKVHLNNHDKMSGFIELENAYVKWFLSIDKNDLPKEAISKSKPTYRSIKIDDEEVEFTEGFTDLHTKVYEKTLAGNGFGIADAKPSVELAYNIRNADISNDTETIHPFLKVK